MNPERIPNLKLIMMDSRRNFLKKSGALALGELFLPNYQLKLYWKEYGRNWLKVLMK